MPRSIPIWNPRTRVGSRLGDNHRVAVLEADAQTKVGNAAFHFFRQGDGLVRAVFLSPDRNNRRIAESCGIGDLLVLLDNQGWRSTGSESDKVRTNRPTLWE